MELLLLSSGSLDPSLFVEAWGHCGAERRQASCTAMAILEQQFAVYPELRNLKPRQTSPRVFNLLRQLKTLLQAVDEQVIFLPHSFSTLKVVLIASLKWISFILKFYSDVKVFHMMFLLRSRIFPLTSQSPLGKWPLRLTFSWLYLTWCGKTKMVRPSLSEWWAMRLWCWNPKQVYKINVHLCLLNNIMLLLFSAVPWGGVLDPVLRRSPWKNSKRISEPAVDGLLFWWW